MYFDEIDPKLWKDLQDKFSAELGIPIFTADMDGKIFHFSGIIPFLLDLIKSKRQDIFANLLAEKIRESDSEEAAVVDLFGSLHLLKPVFLYDRKIGAVLFGPIGKGKQDYKALCARLDVEEDELSGAHEDITELGDQDRTVLRKTISILSSTAPKLAYQKHSKDKQISKLTSLYNIIRKMNSSLELKDILGHIMGFLVDSMEATDCSVTVQDEDGEKRYCLNQGSDDLINIEKQVSRKAIENKEPVRMNELSRRFNKDMEKGYNSIISVPLKLRDKVIGSMNIFKDSFRGSVEENLEFLLTMSDQAAIAVANARQYEEVKELAVVDKLTGTFNRRHFTDMLDKALQKEISLENQLAVILLDIDNFGKYNNTHGHPKGDDLLKEISRIIKDSVREEDSVGRYGGEEFIILLPGVNPKEALSVAERIKQNVSEHEFYGRETQPGGKVTISAGLAICREKVSARMLIDEADEALYRAKNSGKNKVVQRIILKDNLKTEI